MQPLRIAVVGGGRGASYAANAAALPDKVRLECVCDTQPRVLAQWRENGVRTSDDYARVLDDPSIDAVCLATPLKMHARQSIEALNAGKHVLCEVTAAWTLDECRDLIEAVQRTGLTYMMAENACFFRPVLMVQEMVERGVFGELTYAEGDYIHALPEMLFGEDGNLTWRGKLYRDEFCNTYPTHSLGPVCRWLGVTRTDMLKSIASWGTKSHAAAEFVRATRSADDRLREYSQWRLPDGTMTMINTEDGALIKHHLDWMSPRPHAMNRYFLQGTRAAFSLDGEPQIWIGGRSAEHSPGTPADWEPLFKYADEFEHPLWREFGDEAVKSGHGGADYFVLREFADAIREGRPPLFDVYDALTWSAVSPLSEQSLQQGSAPVEVPKWLQRRELQPAEKAR